MTASLFIWIVAGLGLAASRTLPPVPLPDVLPADPARRRHRRDALPRPAVSLVYFLLDVVPISLLGLAGSMLHGLPLLWAAAALALAGGRGVLRRLNQLFFSVVGPD